MKRFSFREKSFQRKQIDIRNFLSSLKTHFKTIFHFENFKKRIILLYYLVVRTISLRINR